MSGGSGDRLKNKLDSLFFNRLFVSERKQILGKERFRMENNMKKIVHGGLVYQYRSGKSTFEKRDIIISDNRIEKIVETVTGDLSAYDEVISAENAIVIPGMINAHIHTHCHFVKGAFDNMPLEVWMLYTKPYFSGRTETPEEVYIKTLFGCIELLKCGTTMIIDDVVHCPAFSEKHYDMVMKAYHDAGLRADVSVHLSNKFNYKTIPYLDSLISADMKRKIEEMKIMPEEEILAYVESLIRKYNTKDAVQRSVLSPSGPQRSTVKLMRGMRELSEKYNIPTVSHILETRVQRETGYMFYGKSLVRWLAENDLLYPNLNAIHTVWVDDDDIELLAKYDCKTVHNPASNLKLGSGIAPIRKLLKAGVKVGLGTDNTSCSDSLNLFESLKLSALLQKVQTPDYKEWIGAEEAVRMATYNGAACACLENELGSLEEGKKADMTILDIDNERFLPHNNFINQLVYCENGKSVKSVVIDGQTVVKDGRITTFDEQEVIGAFKEISERMKPQQELAVMEAEALRKEYEEAYYRTMRTGNYL